MSEPSRGSASVPTLRFPRPQGNQRLANWISSSSPDIMAQVFFVDEDDAVDSYELINTDGETESQDGLTTGSTASSLDLLARPSDEESLSGIDYIHEYETHNTHILVNEPQDYTEEVDQNEKAEEEGVEEEATACEDDEDQSKVGLVTPSRTCDVHKGYLEGTSEALHVNAKASKTIEPETDNNGQYTIMDLIRRSIQSPAFLHKTRTILAVVAFLIFVLFSRMGATVIRSADKVCEQPHSGQTQQAVITTVAMKTPTPVTITVTTTSTILSPAFSDITKRFATSAEGVAKSVENTYLPTVLAFATKVRGEVANWGKAHGLGDTFLKTRNNIKDRFTPYFRIAEDSANNFKLNVLKAQIKSRLIWLQMRGEVAEYQRYQTQARDYLKTKHHQMLTLRGLRDRRPTSTSRWGRSHLRHIFH